MQSAYAPLLIFVLLMACWGLWYGGRAVRKGRGAPAWASKVDRYRALVVLLLGLAVVALFGFGAFAVLAPLLPNA